MTKEANAASSSPGRNGRPTLRTAENAGAICKLIRETGMPVGPAAATVGISAATVSAWLKAEPEFAQQVARAEAACIEARLQELATCQMAKGTPDTKALTWFLERRFSKFFGPKQEIAVEHGGTIEHSGKVEMAVTLSPTQLKALQERRKAALGESK